MAQFALLEQAVHVVVEAKKYPESHFVHLLPSVAHVAQFAILLEHAGHAPLAK